MKGLSGCILVLLSLVSTWGGFEFYHQMREEDFLSLTGILCAMASVVCVLFGAFLARAVAD